MCPSELGLPDYSVNLRVAVALEVSSVPCG